MKRILLAGDDLVFSALVTDRLHLAGYDVVPLAGGYDVLERLARLAFDLAIVDLDLDGVDAVDLIRGVRSNPMTESVPVLVIANHDEGNRRLEALRAGADDAVVRPCHFDEVVFRVGRLIGNAAAASRPLRGDVAGARHWDALQYLERAGSSGTLLVRRLSFHGRIYFDQGAIFAASFDALSGREAVPAMLGLKKGKFRFVSGSHGGQPPLREPISLDGSLLEAAVFEDELARYDEHVPATGEKLRWSGRKPVDVEGPIGDTVRVVTRLLVTNREISLYQLFKRLPLAHQRIRLAVAIMVDMGLVERPLGAGKVPSTTDVEAQHLVGVALYKLLQTSRKNGFAPRVVPFVVLADKEAWGDCVGLLADAGDPDDELARLGNRLRTEHGGTADFKIAGDRLALHFRDISADGDFSVEPLVTGCAGMAIWLGDLSNKKIVERLVTGLEESRPPARGVLVAGSPKVEKWIRKLIGEDSRWRVSSTAPETLLELLRLLR